MCFWRQFNLGYPILHTAGINPPGNFVNAIAGKASPAGIKGVAPNIEVVKMKAIVQVIPVNEVVVDLGFATVVDCEFNE